MSRILSSIPALITAEYERHQNSINLIASENYALPEVLAPLATILNTKYAEGYPGKRYYAGCEIVDLVENEAKESLLDLFIPAHLRSEYVANVQPHAGSQANFAVYNALINPGDTILSMSLAHGGHLTHGHPINLSGKLYHIISYGVGTETGVINYDEVRTLALQHKPKLIICGASAYPRTVHFEQFAAIAQEVGAILLADIAHIAGLIAAGEHPTPVGFADVITSTTHKTLRGPRGAFILARTALGKKIDMSVMPGCQGGPFMHAIGARAIAFQQAAQPAFKQYIQTVIACTKLLAKEMQNHGYFVVSNGTDNHLFLIDLSKSERMPLNGKEAEEILAESGIIVNRNTVPGDTRSPLTPSGLRLGLAAMVTRGIKTEHMPLLAQQIDTLLRGQQSNTTTQEIRRFARQFPLP